MIDLERVEERPVVDEAALEAFYAFLDRLAALGRERRLRREEQQQADEGKKRDG